MCHLLSLNICSVLPASNHKVVHNPNISLTTCVLHYLWVTIAELIAQSTVCVSVCVCWSVSIPDFSALITGWVLTACASAVAGNWQRAAWPLRLSRWDRHTERRWPYLEVSRLAQYRLRGCSLPPLPGRAALQAAPPRHGPPPHPG